MIVEEAGEWVRFEDADKLREQRDEAIALLEDCEFADNSGQEYMPACPICEKPLRHESDCRLGLFLAALKSEGENDECK